MPANESRVKRLVAAIQQAMTTETTREGVEYSADDVVSAYLTSARGACKAVIQHGADAAYIVDVLQSIILEIAPVKGTPS